MRVYEEVRSYKKKTSILGNLQYIISLIIAILFAFGLFSLFTQPYFLYLIGFIFVQIIISILRLKILNVIIQVVLLGLAALSFIPVVGLLFSFFGLLFALLDTAALKDSKIYKQVKVRTFRTSKKTKNKKDIKNKNFKEASFKEK